MGLVAARCIKCNTNIQLDNLQDVALCPACSQQISVRECIRNLWDYAAIQAAAEVDERPDENIPSAGDVDFERQKKALEQTFGGAEAYHEGALMGNDKRIADIANIAKTGTTSTMREGLDKAEPSEEVCLARAKEFLGNGDLKNAYEQYEEALTFNKKSHRAMFGKFLSTGVVQFYMDAINASTSRHAERYKFIGHAINVESFLKYEYLIKEVSIKLKREDLEYLQAFNVLTFKSGFGNGISIMHVVASRDNLDAFKGLFEEGISVNVQNENGSLPIHIAAVAGSPDTIRLLHSAGGNVNTISPLGYSPLMLAVLTGNKGNMQSLISLGADANGCDREGYTPLHYAVSFGKEGKLDAIRLLAAAGANMSPRSKDGTTPLHEAVASERVEALQVLISVGADVNAKNDDGKTPLHLAGRSSRLDIPRLLIESSSDVNAVDNVGNSPLHIAARSGNVEIAKTMVGAGGNPNMINRMNQKPITVAKLRNMDRMVSYLSQFDTGGTAKKSRRDGKKGCYIATAVYGDYDAPQVRVLRRFRNEVLEQTVMGRAFVKFYYFASPSFAKWLEKATFANTCVRKVLDRFVEALSKDEQGRK